jgi:hypothetical protein
MILSAHQPAYLPWLGYFHKIALADVFVVLDAVQFEKNSYINRNKVKTANGEAWLTIPVEMKGHLSRTIADVRMQTAGQWKKKHWNTLLMNYKKASYFNRYADFFAQYYAQEGDSLADFVNASFHFFLNELDIAPSVRKLSELGVASHKQELIIDLCKTTGCDEFVFGALGKDYADEETFKNNSIAIVFQEYRHPRYQQLWGEFVPYMSVVDALFNLGAERTREVIFEGNITKAELERALRGT